MNDWVSGGSVVAEIVGAIRGVHEDWYDLAECAKPGVNPDWWFPPRGGSQDRERARAICHNCPVRLQCLEAAIERAEQAGIFGELDLKGRRRWNRERKAG